MVKKIAVVSLFAFLLMLNACNSQPLSPEDEIRQYLNQGVKAAESRNAGDLQDMIDAAYRDHKGMGKKEIIKLLKVYFFRHKNIHLFTKIEDITLHSEQEASVTLYVAMAGSVINDVSLLSSLRARVYQFELTLIKHNGWLLQQAKWQPSSLSDIPKN